MDILEAVDLIKDYSLFEEQEWEVEKIIRNIKNSVYVEESCLHNNVLIEDIDYLITSGKMKFPLIHYLFKNEPEKSEKLDQLTEALNIIKEYKDSILVARKLNQ